jgi:hypothetical protein
METSCAILESDTLVMDERVVWDAKKKNEVEEAKQRIIAFKNRGFKIIHVNETTGEPMHDKPMQFFRPWYEEVVILAERTFTNIMKILTEKGDERLTWNRDNGLEAMDAKKKFEEWIKKDFKAFSVDVKGKKKKEIFEFDVEAEEILMVPPTYKG